MHLRWNILLTAALAALAASGGAAHAADTSAMQVGRYSSARAIPATLAARPLDVDVRLSYPPQTVQTVGDAIRHTIERTGWSFPDPASLQPEAARLLTLPLPASQRTLGPYPVATVLQILTGDVWQWHRDPVQRVTWFDLAPSAAAGATRRAVIGYGPTSGASSDGKSSLIQPPTAAPVTARSVAEVTVTDLPPASPAVASEQARAQPAADAAPPPAPDTPVAAAEPLRPAAGEQRIAPAHSVWIN